MSTPESVPSTTNDTRTVLVIDDEPSVRTFVTRVLRQGGYQVVEAESGTSAITMSSQLKDCVDLIIVDLMMPGLKGWEVAAELLQEMPSCRVMYMSGQVGGPEHRVPRDGFFLRKPFSPSILLEAAADLLRLPREPLRPVQGQ